MIAEKMVHRLTVKEFDDEARRFTGLASTWNLDVQGDMITRGAFKETLKEWSGRSQPLPLLDSHNAYSTVENVVGKMVSARETEDGLVATFELMPDDPKAAAVYRRIKGGYVDGLSIGFDVAAWEKPTDEERSAGMWRKITRVNLMEVSVVVWPANEQSRITAVKSAVGAINPDRLSEDERRELRALNAQIGNLLRAAQPPRTDEAKQVGEYVQDAEDAPATGSEVTPAADSEAQEEKQDTAPEWQREALLTRLSALRASNHKGE